MTPYPELFTSKALTQKMARVELLKHVHFTVDDYALAWLAGYDPSKYAQVLDDVEDEWPAPGSIVAASIGAPIRGWQRALEATIKRVNRESVIREIKRNRRSTRVAAVALACGATGAVMNFTVGRKAERFRPGKAYGDDARRVVRYFALALESKAARADVTNAWTELLVSRPPDDPESGDTWSWGDLFSLAYAYFHLLGDTPAAEVGAALRQTLRGER